MEDQHSDAQIHDGALALHELHEGERRTQRQAIIQVGIEQILEGLYGPGWKDDPHLQDTPLRAARAWYNEIFAGITQPNPKITTFSEEGDNGMIVLNDIPVRSVCAHHLLPFVGKASVGYTMEGRVLGLSKLSRIVDWHSRRPQVQERLTNNVADTLVRLKATGVGVVVRANHMCMQLRGVNHDGDMVTSAIRGVFQEPEVRAEFLKLAGVERG